MGCGGAGGSGSPGSHGGGGGGGRGRTSVLVLAVVPGTTYELVVGDGVSPIRAAAVTGATRRSARPTRAPCCSRCDPGRAVVRRARTCARHRRERRSGRTHGGGRPRREQGSRRASCRPAPLTPSTCLAPGRGGAGGGAARGSVEPPPRAGAGGAGGDAGRPECPAARATSSCSGRARGPGRADAGARPWMSYLVVFRRERLHARPRARRRAHPRPVRRRVDSHLDQHHRRRAGRHLPRELPGRRPGGPRGIRADARGAPGRRRAREPRGAALASGLGGLAPRTYPFSSGSCCSRPCSSSCRAFSSGWSRRSSSSSPSGDLGRAGNVVGRVYAASTVGSLVGTFSDGLRPDRPRRERAIVLSVGLTLVALGGHSRGR